MAKKQTLFNTEEPSAEDLKKQVKVKKAISDAAYKIVGSFSAEDYPFGEKMMESIATVLKDEIKHIFEANQ